jgi:nickel-dependent lactate racemase
LTRLAYGKSGLDVILDDRWNVQVVEPKYVAGVADPREALREGLQSPIASQPLARRVKPTDRVGIIFNDITRATPNQLIIPAILAELGHVPRENITLFDALGTHRSNTDAELRQMLGDELVDGYRIVQNDCLDQATQVCIGRTSLGHDIWINRALMDCDFKILTGFIEPHFFAGFSGGGKAIMPGMAGLDTILGNHCAANIGSPNATWGITEGNPLWEEVREVSRKAHGDFLVNVTLNRDKEITAVFVGDVEQAHARGCTYAKDTAMVAVDKPFDIVVTSNSGYPLDLNLYQTVKGMSAAALVVRQGGAIVIASECWDGIPEHGLYGQLLSEASSPQEILEKVNKPGFSKQDQWEAQVQALVQMKADVYVHSGHLSEEQIVNAMLLPASSVEETLKMLVSRYGEDARICVLPEGPVTIPYIRT